jgi:hypothetical protein
MKDKMFGHRMKRKSSSSAMDPGRPYNQEDMDHSMDRSPRQSMGRAKDNPPGYEGKEHVKYKNPGYSKHNIRYPEDEPHMKSHVYMNEEHEAEDNYHMGVPNQTQHNLEKHIKRARMLMDAPNQQDPKPLRGNIVHDVGYEGEEDTSGEEEMGPHDMQEDEEMPKEHRKKMVIAVMKRKMKKNGMDKESSY